MRFWSWVLGPGCGMDGPRSVWTFTRQAEILKGAQVDVQRLKEHLEQLQYDVTKRQDEVRSQQLVLEARTADLSGVCPCACICVRTCVRVCGVCVCVRACVCACVRVRVHAGIWAVLCSVGPVLDGLPTRALKNTLKTNAGDVAD